MRNRRTAAVLLAAGALAGCAHPSAPPPRAEIQAPVVRPLGVEDPAKLPATPPGACVRTASLRPEGTKPTGPTLTKVLDRGRLIVGVNQNAFKVGYRNPRNGELEGFEIDIARAIARTLFRDDSPNRLQFKAAPSLDRIRMVKDGDVDILIRTTVMSCRDWDERIAFSTEYYHASQKLLVPRTSTVKEIEELAGKKICAATGSTSIANIPVFSPRAIPVGAPDVADCLVLLQQGQVDAISTSDILLAALVAQDRNYKVVGRALKDQPYGIMIAQGAPDLVRFVNAVLERIRADGTWTRFHRTWLSALGPPPAPPRAVYR